MYNAVSERSGAHGSGTCAGNIRFALQIAQQNYSLVAMTSSSRRASTEYTALWAA
jgi:hypothetical protein